MNLLEEPGHVLTEGLHGLETFSIIPHIAGSQADADIPITGPGDDHLID